MSDRLAPTDYPIEPLLAARWSPRAFDSRPIGEAALASLFEAARWAPSASNSQPWAFVHAARGTTEFGLLLGCLKEANAVWAQYAPVLVLAIARHLKIDGTPNPYARYDLGQSVAHLSIQATALGLHVHQMAGFDAARAHRDMAIAATFEAVAAIAIGHLGDVASLPATLQERERSARTRKPASHFAFSGLWPADIDVV